MTTTQGWASTLSADRMRPSRRLQDSIRHELSGVDAGFCGNMVVVPAAYFRFDRSAR
jgi:hypothetical protein